MEELARQVDLFFVAGKAVENESLACYVMGRLLY
jgi:hypothetical protein